MAPLVAQEADMLRRYLMRIADEQLAARRAVIAQIRTGADVERRQTEVRAAILRMMGGLPTQRAPLNVQRTGTLERDGYRIEKVVYESLPKFYVTANLYIPTTGSGPFPAVLQPLGHSQTAKARGLYQSLSIGLATHGFVVLTYDPIGQGERTIFYDERTETSRVGSSTREHQMVGVQSLLAGESVARYRVWDGMRGIDLLASLSEVDAERIGIAGCSGGGTLSTYIAALDDRVKVAAPACYISSWEEQLEGTGPQDAEQEFPDQLKLGINHADFVIAFAPKPYLICNTTEDFFPIAGARRTLEEVRRIYKLMDAVEKIDQYVGPGGHGMRRDTRQAIYAWMNRWLQNEPPHAAAEPDHLIEYDEDLYATPTGQVATSLGGETASTWNIKRFSKVRPSRSDSARDSVAKVTRFERPTGSLATRTLGSQQHDGYAVESLVYDTGPHRWVPALLCIPDANRSKRQPVVFVDDRGKAPVFEEGGDAAELCSSGYTVLALDLSGTGETASKWGSYSSEWFGGDKITWLALMVGRPLVGLRMADIVRSLDFLEERKLLSDQSAMGFARGKSGVVLLHTAVIDSRLSSLMLEDPLVSYKAIAETPIHRRVFASVLPGVLYEYDLADLVAAISPRRVALVNVRSPLDRLMLSSEVREHYPGVDVRIGFRREGEALFAAYPELSDTR